MRKQRLTNLVYLSLTLLTILLLTACQAAPAFECTDALGCVTITPGDPLKIGVLQVLSGDLEPLGREQLQSIELAVEDRGGELLGHPIELQSEDSKCSAEGGTTAALKIVADPQMIAVVGPTCSGAGPPQPRSYPRRGW